MEYEETPHFTPRGSTKLKVPGAKVAANLKRRLSNRLSRTISSERAPGSDASNDNAETPRSKRFSLKHRRSKSRAKKEEEKTMAPRRSFSVDDLSKLVPDDVDKEPIALVETEVKVPPLDETDDLAPEILPESEGLGPVPPETPVPEQRPVEIRDIRSSSMSMDAAETKELASDHEKLPEETTEVTEKVEPVESVERDVEPVGEIEPAHTFDLSPDADATIDAGIEETVLASLTAQEQTDEVETKLEPKTLDDVHAVVTQSMEEKEAAEKPTETVEEPAEVQTESRDVDLEALIEHEAEEVSTHEVEQIKEPTKDVKAKPKRKRRFAKLIKPASFSLATLAVGLLLIILKKH